MRCLCLQEEATFPLHILRCNRASLDVRERLIVKSTFNALLTLIVLSAVLFPRAAQAQQTATEGPLFCGYMGSVTVTYTLDRSDLYEGDIANGTITFPECSDGSAGYAAARLEYRILCDAPWRWCVSNYSGNPFSYYVFHDLNDILDPGVNPSGPNGKDAVIGFFTNGTNPAEWVNSASFGISFYDDLAPYTTTFSIYDATEDAQTYENPPLFTLTVHPDNSTDLGGPGIESSGCEGTCGMPINLTNGNTWIEQHDYSLPGLGGGLGLSRTWNSYGRSLNRFLRQGCSGTAGAPTTRSRSRCSKTIRSSIGEGMGAPGPLRGIPHLKRTS
jgi:hypothetical protein